MNARRRSAKIFMRQSQQRVFIVLIVLCLLMSPSCKRLRSRSSDARPKPAFGPSGNPGKDLGDALMRLKTAYPYRVNEEFGQSGGSSSSTGKYVVEYSAPDRVHYKSDSHESIEIGDKRYAYYSGQWVETGPAAKGPEIERILAEHVNDVRLAGSEDVNGIPCTAYTMRYEFSWKGRPETGTAKIWISTSDGLPRQLDSEVKRGDGVAKTHRVYEYDPTIKVEKPIP